jgi:hypothetical protein
VGEVSERILADGTIDTPLDAAELLEEGRRLSSTSASKGSWSPF